MIFICIAIDEGEGFNNDHSLEIAVKDHKNSNIGILI